MKKMIQDRNDERNRKDDFPVRQNMAEFVRHHLKSEYGLKQLAQEKQQQMVNAILLHGNKENEKEFDSRIWIFGIMAGILDHDS